MISDPWKEIVFHLKVKILSKMNNVQDLGGKGKLAK